MGFNGIDEQQTCHPYVMQNMSIFSASDSYHHLQEIERLVSIEVPMQGLTKHQSKQCFFL